MEHRMNVPPDQSYHHGNLRGALVERALVMLEKVGPAELSLRSLAAATGVSRAAPYNHFADKGELLSAIAAAGLQKLAENMRSQDVQPSTPRDRFLAVGRAYVRFALENPNLFKLMFTSPVGPRLDEPQLLHGRGGPYGIFASALSAYLEDVNSSALDGAIARVTAWSCVHGLAGLLLEGRLPLSAESDDRWISDVTCLFADLVNPSIKHALVPEARQS
jgi:AcrR family transcriptional regulator